ncbi:MAG TPA: hypothetical protein VK061_02215 [Bacillota bacterium]|nr:hypothetical protein [Bacillota bacterium]
MKQELANNKGRLSDAIQKDDFDELLYKYIFDIEKESELLKAYKENK